MLETLRLSIDNKGFAGAVLMDLRKAFVTIHHQLSILHVYGFSLSNQKTKDKILNVFSSWKDCLKYLSLDFCFTTFT